jgi:epoxyqueuosine reductase QueG
MKVNYQIRKILKTQYVDYIGFADIRSYKKELMKHGGYIVENYDSAISIGIVIPNSIVNFLPNRSDDNVSCEYKTHGYDVLNQRLDLIASLISSYLNQKNYQALPIAVASRTDEENAIPTVSHKMIAHIAGLGWIGKNCLLITHKHGPRVRFITVLTNAPLKTVNKPIVQQCNDCMECVKACPVNAIKGHNYIENEDRETRFEFTKCHNYFENMKLNKKYAVCGMCLYSCPYGMK